MPGELVDVMSLRFSSTSRGSTLPVSSVASSPRWDNVSKSSKRRLRLLPARRTLVRCLVAGAVTAVLLFRWMVETHVQIAFYKRGWIRQLLPPEPPPLSSRCFSQRYLDDPHRPQGASQSFPSSPLYNLTLGTLGLAPKVLALSPGFDLPHHDDCYRFARTLPQHPLPQMQTPTQTKLIHLYWRSDLSPISERQIITLESILATQSFQLLPNLKPSHEEAEDLVTHVVLWTNPSQHSLLDNKLLSNLVHRFPNRISVRVLNLSRLAKGTAMEEHELLQHVFDKRAWLDGDLVRVLVLWNFGGYWIDMDDLVTRDLSVLGEHEWVVMWDCYDKAYEPLNGHMMHFLQHSPYLCEMLSIMSNPPKPRPASTDWGQHLYHRLYRSLIASKVTPFKVLPFCLTDARSCTLKDRLPDPFASEMEESSWKWSTSQWQLIEERVKSVFAIHLHNQWEKSFVSKGWVQRILVSDWQRTLKSQQTK